MTYLQEEGEEKGQRLNDREKEGEGSHVVVSSYEPEVAVFVASSTVARRVPSLAVEGLLTRIGFAVFFVTCSMSLQGQSCSTLDAQREGGAK
jgi:hypothetical protein